MIVSDQTAAAAPRNAPKAAHAPGDGAIRADSPAGRPAHERPQSGNTGPMLASPRCGAKTRSGGGCRAPAVHGKKRCRMHGGAPGSGAPRANQNARKHGLFTRDAIEERREIRELLGEARRILKGAEVTHSHMRSREESSTIRRDPQSRSITTSAFLETTAIFGADSAPPQVAKGARRIVNHLGSGAVVRT